jgi:hypothetical protein
MMIPRQRYLDDSTRLLQQRVRVHVAAQPAWQPPVWLRLQVLAGATFLQQQPGAPAALPAACWSCSIAHNTMDMAAATWGWALFAT